MKSSNKYSFLAVLGVLVAAALIFPQFTHGKEKERSFTKLKIGYVDFEKVFNEYHKTKEGNEILNKEKVAKEDEGKKLVDAINKMRQEAELLSQDAKKKKEEEIKQKIKELREFTEITRRDLIKKRNDMWKGIFEDIRAVVQEKGKNEDYSLIFDDKALLFKLDGLDLTEEVIQVLNKEGTQG